MRQPCLREKESKARASNDCEKKKVEMTMSSSVLALTHYPIYPSFPEYPDSD
jgi:hypothetical protein